MGTRWVRPLVAATLVVLGACRERSDDEGATPTTDDAPSTTSADTTAPPTTQAPRKTSTTRAPRSTTTASTSTTTTTTPPTTVPPSTAPPAAAALPVAVPGCVVEVAPGDTLELIVAGVGTVDVAGVQAENGLADPNVINVGAYLDVCVGNDVDDITGASRTPPAAPAEPAAPVAPETTAPLPPPVGYGVAAQQQKLNELFYGTGFSGLTVDGDSGNYTEQALCAARLTLGLPASRADMEPGGAEEAALMAATSLSMPLGAPTGYGRWVLIDRTCQVLFVGEGADRLVYVFPTSTGEPGFGTRTQDASPVFRYDPAVGNNGWHNSYDYPVGGDNPLNGNMYKPLYFDGGQAIHGANNVPPWPRSKGCARLRVGDQQQLVDWVGLGGVRSQLYNAADQIGLVVSVQGDF